MSEGWDVRPLGELCTIKPPKAEARSRLSDTDPVSFVPMEDLGIGVKALIPTRTRALGEVSGSYTYFADGDVLLAKITPCFENGKLGVARGLVNGIGFGSSEFIVLRPGLDLDAEFLYYYLARPSFLEEGARSMTGAVGHKRVAKEFIEAYPVPLPSRSEQRRIVAILDEAFEGIATAKANAEKNLQNARELFESRLGHLFSDLKEDGPKTRIADLCDIKHGYAFDGAHFSGNDDGQAPILLTPGNFAENGRLQFSERNTKRYTNTDIPRGFVLDDGDLVVVMTDLSSTMKILGKPAIVDRPQLLHNQRIGRVVSLQAGVATRYVYYFMRTAGYVRGIKRTATGTMVKHTAPTRILDAVLPLPPIERQAEIIDALDEAEEQVQMLETNYQRRSAALDELKKSLLHQAFNGAL
ncbi:MAG: restriction endonuclease subunit S [Proteobacteria bacterium]|nr:restriction endonuclease subunit S [Pseudomonadota bacterium]